MTFDDLEGNPTSQTFYFNYNKKEVAELLEFKQLEEKLAKLMQPVEESGLTQIENNQQAYDIFQDLIIDAYGEKGADNVTFVKNERTREYFKNHVAFVELIFEFLEKPELAAQFIESCLPAKMVAQAKAEFEKEHGRNISSATLTEMVQEADRRQQDPATRIEPGPEAAAKVLGENPEVAQLAESVKDGGVPAKKPEDLTPDDVRFMDEVAFKKLDPQKLSRETMVAAFHRKSQG